MSLTAGQQLLHYRIDEPIGEGGMGVVWKARDTRLGRDVAVKVLPAEVSSDPDRLARFDREARALAALHHPNVASIFGFEESEGVRFLVMELVEGEDLARRLERGAPGVEEALQIARQVAEGLEAAHEHGIIHRDLKPANVKIAPDGTVKVLDFGLAKARGSEGSGSVSGSGALSQSPTLAQTGTAAGLILGTAAYMSPEQARGKTLDRRSDIWSFGAVLFEVLTGRQLFAGETVSDVLASVLKSDVDLDALPEETPGSVRRLLRRCLARDPKQRLRDIGDARLEIAAALAGEDEAASGAGVGSRRFPASIPWLIAAGAVVALVAALALSRQPGPAPSASYELALSPPANGQWLVGSNIGWGAISPDGRWVVGRASTPEGTGLWVRSLSGGDGRFLPRTEDGFYPFWSPDSRWVAFFNRGLLQRVEIDGGLPERISVAEWGRGGSWSESGQILMTPVGGGSIHVVAAEGGEPRPVTQVNFEAGESAHYWPVWLPDGERFLYFIRSGRREDQGIYLGRVLADGPDESRHRVVASSSSGVLSTGPGGTPMLLWVQDETLLARAFDPASGSVSGPTTRLAENVRVLGSQRGAMVSVSADGTLVWASSRFGNRRLTWFDRNGRALESVKAPDASLHQPTNSPDGRWVSFVVVEEGQGDVWLLDTRTGESRALTSSALYEESVTWSPDSEEIVYEEGSGEDGAFIRIPIDGSESPRAVLEDVGGLKVTEFAAWLAGDWIVCGVMEADGTRDLVAVKMGGTEEPIEVAAGIGDQYVASVSPSGDSLAYLSDESGKLEVYLVSLSMRDGRPVPGPDRQRIPLDDEPGLIHWHPMGGTLYVLSRGGLFAISVENRNGRPRVGGAERLFDLPAVQGTNGFAVSPSGDRFLFVVDPDAPHQALSVLLNWTERLN